MTSRISTFGKPRCWWTSSTAYLRLMGAAVPALYGPSADDQTFA